MVRVDAGVEEDGKLRKKEDKERRKAEWRKAPVLNSFLTETR